VEVFFTLLKNGIELVFFWKKSGICGNKPGIQAFNDLNVEQTGAKKAAKKLTKDLLRYANRATKPFRRYLLVEFHKAVETTRHNKQVIISLLRFIYFANPINT